LASLPFRCLKGSTFAALGATTTVSAFELSDADADNLVRRSYQ
jgi:hypothetical protein